MPEDLLRPEGRATSVAASVQSRTAFLGTTHIDSVVVQGDRRPLKIPLTELEALHRDGPFVEPGGYDVLTQAVRGRQVVVCSGPAGTGRDRAVTRALLATGHRTIRMLPSGLGSLELARAVEAVAEQADACVINVTDPATLRALAGASGGPIRSVAATGRTRIVVITSAAADVAVRRTTAPVSLRAPDADDVAQVWCDERGATDRARGLARDVVNRLGTPGPAVVAALVQEVVRDEDRAPDVVAALFGSSAAAEALDEWLTEQRSSSDVAALAAAVTLSGHPPEVVHAQLQGLRRLLNGPMEEAGTGTTGRHRSVWPERFIRLTTAQARTHFGTHPIRVVGTCPPYRPEDLAQALWQSLGEGFRSAFATWLASLAEEPALGWDAADTAGALFVCDPVMIEAQILRPWALHEHHLVRQCAGIALGTPIALDADPTAARRLAHQWASGDNERLQQAAVAAYGGPLGVWDVPSSAPLKLFRIGYRTPALRGLSDRALARLVVAGADAAGARRMALDYLAMLATDRHEQERVFGCLPLVVDALTDHPAACRESCEALLDEPESWADLMRVLGCALVIPRGVPHGAAAVSALIRAVAVGRLDLAVVERMVRELKTARRRSGTVGRLGMELKRVFAANARSRDAEVRSVATTLLDIFFGTKENSGHESK